MTMNSTSILNVVLNRLPDAHTIRDISMMDEAVRFSWGGTQFQIDHNLNVHSYDMDDDLAFCHKSRLISALLRQDKEL